ncbi:hypothetical protein M6B38_307535 [Iris pallida]|uniref:Uncharacterized protein n=1 Tax=Iris pallida TaxID=29817 RepID=A0AAX6HLE5_IRIPA|nr:hypothetical protein M6B38_307535 [Iris pallida]
MLTGIGAGSVVARWIRAVTRGSGVERRSAARGLVADLEKGAAGAARGDLAPLRRGRTHEGGTLISARPCTTHIRQSASSRGKEGVLVTAVQRSVGGSGARSVVARRR